MSRLPLHLICGVSETATWREVNLDQYAQADFPTGKNPLLDPNLCAVWVASLAAKKSVDYTYGGYMEDRSHLWRGHYMKRGHCVHYGVDLNVPAGTEVLCPVPFRVVEMFHNVDQLGGWGGRVTVETESGGIVVFAHVLLWHLVVGEPYPHGTTVGWVAESKHNGGWYPHLHLQGLKSLDQLEGLDGYGRRYKGMEKDYPNPLEILLPR